VSVSPTETRPPDLAHVEGVLKLVSARPLWLHRGVFGGLRSHIDGLMKAAALTSGGVVRRALSPAEGQGAIRGLVLDLMPCRATGFLSLRAR